MQIIALISSYGGWSWIVAGLALLALELVVPGGVLLWLGIAALVTGGLALALPIYWPVQFLIYGAGSLAEAQTNRTADCSTTAQPPRGALYRAGGGAFRAHVRRDWEDRT